MGAISSKDGDSLTKFGILCCESLSKELELVLSSIGADDVEVTFFQTHCHAKENDVDESQHLRNLQKECSRIVVLGCGCLSKLNIPNDENVIILGCGAELFFPSRLLHYLTSSGYMLVVPGWLRKWREHIQKAGLDKDTARSMFKESVKSVMVLDTGISDELIPYTEEIAEFFDLECRILPVGTAYLEKTLSAEISRWTLNERTRVMKEELASANKIAADMAMVFDLLDTIVSQKEETKLIENLLDIFITLFSPQTVLYVDRGATVVHFAGRTPNYDVPDEDLMDFLSGDKSYELIGGTGFIIRLQHQGEPLGAIMLEGMIYPERVNDYLNISMEIVGVFGLALSNSRAYQRLNLIISELAQETEIRRLTEEALRASNRKLNLLSSITRHDINNNLTVLMGYTEMLLNLESDPSKRRYLEAIMKASEGIESMIKFTKEYDGIGVKSPVWSNVRALIDDAAARSMPLPFSVINNVPSDIEIFIDPMGARAFYNIVENAKRHAVGATHLTFGTNDVGERLIITAEDDGSGILSDEKERIFERGFGKNTGLGLFLVKEILSITDIDIIEDGKPGEGARFRIIVPPGCHRHR